MPTWLKVTLGIPLFLAMLLGVLGGGAWLLGRSLAPSLKRVTGEATRFAAEHKSADCVDEAVRRLGKEEGVVDATEAQLFLMRCLEQAEQTQGFCDGVPPTVRFQTPSALRWNDEQCAARGLGGHARCQGLFIGVRGFCEQARQLPK